jgi:tetratricopeptide (TPR) repeat protein
MRVWALVISLTALAAISHIWAQNELVFFVSGDVRLEDGTAPPDSVQINRVCSGRTISAAMTDSTGHFSFSVSAAGSTASTSDAGQSSAQAWDLGKAMNQTSTQYTNPITSALRDCEVQAVLSGFRTGSVRLTVRDTADDGRLGTIVLHPLSRSGSLTISATTSAAPAAAKKAYDKGMESSAKSKWEDAESELTKAVTIYPKFAIAWYQLGQVRQKRNVPAGAMQAWNEARKQDPKYVKPYESLAAVADRQQDWASAEQYSRELLQLDPDDFPAAYLINAVANANLNHAEAAELAARSGLRIDKDRKVARLDYVLGLILMQKQQYAESAKYFRAYLELAPNARDAATVREQVAKLDHQAEAGLPH